VWWMEVELYSRPTVCQNSEIQRAQVEDNEVSLDENLHGNHRDYENRQTSVVDGWEITVVVHRKGLGDIQ